MMNKEGGDGDGGSSNSEPNDHPTVTAEEKTTPDNKQKQPLPSLSNPQSVEKEKVSVGVVGSDGLVGEESHDETSMHANTAIWKRLVYGDNVALAMAAGGDTLPVGGIAAGQSVDENPPALNPFRTGGWGSLVGRSSSSLVAKMQATGSMLSKLMDDAAGIVDDDMVLTEQERNERTEEAEENVAQDKTPVDCTTGEDDVQEDEGKKEEKEKQEDEGKKEEKEKEDEGKKIKRKKGHSEKPQQET